MKGGVVSISEALRLTGLSAQELLTLLDHGELPFSSGEQGNLQIDLGRTGPKALGITRLEVGAKGAAQSSSESEREETASIILEELGPVLIEAMQIALRWIKTEANPEKK